MKAILLEEPRRLRRIETAAPEEPAGGDAIVRVHRVGICGTDIAGYLGKMPFFSYPCIPGHELGVEVVAIGENVRNVKPGDRCSVEPYLNCQDCFACRRGNCNCCEKLRVLGVHVDGGLRPEFSVSARKLHKSATLELEQLALVETLGVGCHCVDRTNPEPGETVLVIGAGPIGLSVIEFLRIAKTRILVMDLNQQRLEFCKNVLKVDQTIQVRGDGSELKRLRNLTDGKMSTAVIDATGNPNSMADSIEFVAHTGRLIYVGITTEKISIPHPKLHAREMSILCSRNALPSDFGRIIRLIEEGTLDTRPWITHRTDFDELIDVFPSYLQSETGVIKAIVHVSD